MSFDFIQRWAMMNDHQASGFFFFNFYTCSTAIFFLSQTLNTMSNLINHFGLITRNERTLIAKFDIALNFWMDAKIKEALYLAIMKYFISPIFSVDNNILEFTRFQRGLLLRSLTEKEYRSTWKTTQLMRHTFCHFDAVFLLHKLCSAGS